MNHIEVESTYLTYLKLFEGLNIPLGYNKTACDLSFNNGITAKYLIDKKNYQKVYVCENKKRENTRLASNAIVNIIDFASIKYMKFDFFISLGGFININPLYELILHIFQSLNIGGRLLIAVYPDIFSDSGKDILHLLSNLLEIPVKEKLMRLRRLIFNGVSNIFNSANEFEILQDVTINEIKNLYMLDTYSNYICSSEDDLLKFFVPLDKMGKKFYFGWNIIEAMKL
jgi:hypothetical protein